MKVTSTQPRSASMLNRVSAAANAPRATRCERPLAAHGGEIVRARMRRVRCVPRCSEACVRDRMLLRVGAPERILASCSEARVPITPKTGDLRIDRHNACLSCLGIQLSERFMLRVPRLSVRRPAWQRRSRAAT
jgi:hypothetical protein